MSIRSADVGRITLTDSYKRDCPADATPEALAAQTAAYLARGGRIHEVPAGVMCEAPRTTPNAQQRASAGGKKGGAAKKGLPNRGKKSEIRMEDFA